LDAGAAVLLALQEDGFALARVPPPDAVVDHDTRTMDVVYYAEPGQRLAIGEVRVIGLERLREAAVLRRLGITPGEPFSPSRLEAARRDLLTGGVLAWARLTPGDVPDAQGRLPVTLELAERPRRVIRLAGAFSSDEGLTVSTSWTHRNLLGGGERLTLTGDIGQISGTDVNSLSYLVNASLLLPDLWVRDLDLRLDLGAVKEDLDAYDREAVTAGLIFERRLSPGLSAGAGVAFERSRISQDGPPRDYQLVSAPLTLRYDSTDAPLDPRRGLRLAAQLTPTQVLQGEGSGFVLGRLAGSAYLDLGPGMASPQGPGRLVLAGRLVVGSIVGAAAEDVPPDWRFYAGGGGSVRGYPFQSIGPRTASGSPAGGDGLLESSLELRQRLNANWGAVAFVDAGSVSRDSMPGTGALAVGVGIGLRYFTPIGPVRADIAAPLDRDIGDSPVQLYIGIGQSF
jgi:translocation and assembly module TamA